MVDILSSDAIDDPELGVCPDERRKVSILRPGSAGIVFNENFEVIDILPTAVEVLRKAPWLEPGARLCAINGLPPIRWKAEGKRRPCVLEFTASHNCLLSKPFVPLPPLPKGIGRLWSTDGTVAGGTHSMQKVASTHTMRKPQTMNMSQNINQRSMNSSASMNSLSRDWDDMGRQMNPWDVPVTTTDINTMPSTLPPARSPLSRFGNLAVPRPF